MNAESDESNRAFLALMLPNQKALRNFIYSIHPHSSDLDDIMQETALSLWNKFHTFDQAREFLPWSCRLAYFEVLRFRKTRSRDRLVFSEELLEQLTMEVPDSKQVHAACETLEKCLGKLDDRSRAIVEARYGQGTSLASFAAAHKESVHRLYRLLEKTRLILVHCVRQEMSHLKQSGF